MQEFHGRATARIDAAPTAVFDFITNVDRLPEWNDAIEAVVDKPPALVQGAEWTVKIHPHGLPPWKSISRVVDIDRQSGRFAHETRNADGNPSYVRWAWQVTGAGAGAELTVSWDCYLKTFDRRVLGGPVRKRQLSREVPSSLAAIGRAVQEHTESAS
ncbi:MAG TPA: SRPBCC family protein [Streptosporangiaceae bacterium]|nr:SRPBCC family protein [Streptosporangiaceae bacterium]